MYIPFAKAASSTSIQIYEKAENHNGSLQGGGTMALLSDHRIERMNIKSFQEPLAQTEKW